MTTYDGACLCSKVQFKITAELQKVLICDCSYCRKKNLKFILIQISQFVLIRGNDQMVYYNAGSPDFRHVFCASCGVEPFAEIGRRNGTELIAINANCVPGLQDNELPEIAFDCNLGIT
jgi:hypothetical protein